MMREDLFSSLMAEIAALARDRDIVAHACRVMRLAWSTAQRLELSQERVSRLGLAALLHDMGKIAIPKAILNKPGSLTDEEWDMMRLLHDAFPLSIQGGTSLEEKGPEDV